MFWIAESYLRLRLKTELLGFRKMFCIPCFYLRISNYDKLTSTIVTCLFWSRNLRCNLRVVIVRTFPLRDPRNPQQSMWDVNRETVRMKTCFILNDGTKCFQKQGSEPSLVALGLFWLLCACFGRLACEYIRVCVRACVLLHVVFYCGRDSLCYLTAVPPVTPAGSVATLRQGPSFTGELRVWGSLGQLTSDWLFRFTLSLAEQWRGSCAADMFVTSHLSPSATSVTVTASDFIHLLFFTSFSCPMGGARGGGRR